MTRRVRIRGPQVAGLALGGVVLGHCVAYLLAYPLAPARHQHLQATGHGSFWMLAVAAALAVPLALALAALGALRSTGRPRIARTAAALLAIQLPAFGVVEAAERGFSPAAAGQDPAVWIGLVLQVLLALAVAWLLSLLVDAVRHVAARIRGRFAAPLPTRRTVDVARTLHAHHLVRARRRAPPLLLRPA